MSIGLIVLKSCLNDHDIWKPDRLEIETSGKVQLDIGSDSGVITVFWYGPEMKGRLGDSYASPHTFFIDEILPGEHKIVIEQYRFGKRIDSKTWLFKVLATASVEPNASTFGIADLARIDPNLSRDLVLQLNIQSMREWFSTNGFNAYRSRALTRTQGWSANQIVPIFCFAESGLTEDQIGDVKTWTAAAIDDIRLQLPGVKFRVEMGNEINLQIAGNGAFWDSDDVTVPAKIARYIDRVQKPMYETIKSIDPAISCVAPSLSWDHEMLERLADDLLEFADELAFHPYPNGVSKSDLLRVDESVKTARHRNVRLNYTESQLNYGKKLRAKHLDEMKWAADVQQYMLYAKNAGVNEQHYFVGIDAGTTNSPAALFRKISGKIVPTVFYESFANVTRQ